MVTTFTLKSEVSPFMSVESRNASTKFNINTLKKIHHFNGADMNL